VRRVVVRPALSAAKDDDHAADESRGVRAAQRGQVALHLTMRPLHRLWEKERKDQGHKGSHDSAHAPILKHHMPNIHAPLPARVTFVRAKAMSGERSPYGSLAPVHHGRQCRLDVERIWEIGDRAETGRRIRRGGAGRLSGDLARGRGGKEGRACVGGRCGEVARGAVRWRVTGGRAARGRLIAGSMHRTGYAEQGVRPAGIWRG